MATETGTATNYKDLLQKLKLFLTGTNSPASGLSWVVEEERSSFTSPLSDIPDGDPDSLIQNAVDNNQDHDQIIFRGNGGTSPEKEIYFGIQTMGLSTDGYFNWQIRGLTGFATSSPQYVSLANQPGRSPPVYVPLQNTTMTYWFVGNNRRVIGVVKTGTSYQMFYIGLLNPFATDAEYPYPMAVFGTSPREDLIFSANNVSLSSALNPGGSTTTTAIPQGETFPANECGGFVRFTDGNWYGVKNHTGESGTETRHTFATGALMGTYPFANASQTPHEQGNRLTSTHNWILDWGSTTPGGTPTYQNLPALGSPGQTMLWPITVMYPIAEQFVGDLDGLYWAPAAGGVTSEDTFTDSGESPEVEHIVFQNVWRTDGWMFFAVRNE